MPDDAGHVPVLLDEVIELLDPKPGDAVIDCTAGRGGHAAALVERIGPGGVLLALDRDADNAAYTRQRLAPIAERVGATAHVEHASFAETEAVRDRLGLGGVNVVLADLGFASNQMDDASRGLSFQADGPLDMRLDATGATGGGPTAGELVNELDEKSLADLIYEFGEERLSRRIARNIVAARREGPISTTQELARLVRRAYGPRAGGRVDPATRTFMALRIAVNDELVALDRLLDQVERLLKPGGRVGVISFHSLEDRRVKHRWAEAAQQGRLLRVTRKPVTADDEECRANPRARSAKLRVAELVEATHDAPPTRTR
ncbi:MAG: 16S rRNA (cytosine(1402)-N(4))-methyltransferase RsmH [Planctomycetota bacterium]